ncbi:ADP-ribosylation/crystallin J1 [uncultured Litoreibacter sp.]|uniref:ADP-ribosylation/crystallin J1 n=1 Tax=uncultured Litoreibacter sp. TaxID=1392394 RepID=UPI00261EE370|nr:ADP-ribosylation/crystallin J1 [uncultured Litoreibacter sp.]
MSKEPETVTLWRPIGPEELVLIEQSNMREFPPRLPEQPIFYPVLTEEYAIKIARDWNVKASGSGFVTRFEVLKSYLDAYDVQEAGGRAHLEYWIPAEEMIAFNDAIVGQITVVQEFR